MQRIARLHDHAANAALDGHADLQGVLRRYLPPSTVSMYARPKLVEGGIVEWYSELGGQPVPLSELDRTDSKQADEVRRLLAERLAAVRQAADNLYVPGEDSATQTERLRQLLQAAGWPPEEKNVYVLDGQPVITAWGGGEPPPVPPVAAAAIEAASVAPMARKRRWWPWLLLFLLALLGALLWWLYCREPETPLPPAVQTPVAEEPATEAPPDDPEPPVEQAVPDPLPEPPPRPPEPVVEPEPEPEPPEEPPPPPPPPPPPKPDPVAQLRQRISRAGSDCNALQQLQTTEPLLKTNRALRAEVENQLLQHCKAQMITQAKNLCPDERVPELAPEMLIVFDASGSMDISLLASPEEIRRVQSGPGGLVEALGGLLGIRLPNAALQSVLREPKRITVARQATTAVVEQLPSDVSAGLVLVEQCPAARSVGFFAPAQRDQLLQHLRGVKPVEGTPLADGIRRAGAMLDGVNRESVMLVVSDGEESCGLDPCAAARELARRKPYLKINVVDILGTGAGACLAAATGGQVFTANNVSDLQRMTRQAAQDVLPPAHCRP